MFAAVHGERAFLSCECNLPDEVSVYVTWRIVVRHVYDE